MGPSNPSSGVQCVGASTPCVVHGNTLESKTSTQNPTNSHSSEPVLGRRSVSLPCQSLYGKSVFRATTCRRVPRGRMSEQYAPKWQLQNAVVNSSCCIPRSPHQGSVWSWCNGKQDKLVKSCMYLWLDHVSASQGVWPLRTRRGRRGDEVRASRSVLDLFVVLWPFVAVSSLLNSDPSPPLHASRPQPLARPLFRRCTVRVSNHCSSERHSRTLTMALGLCRPRDRGRDRGNTQLPRGVQEAKKLQTFYWLFKSMKLNNLGNACIQDGGNRRRVDASPSRQRTMGYDALLALLFVFLL